MQRSLHSTAYLINSIGKQKPWTSAPQNISSAHIQLLFSLFTTQVWGSFTRSSELLILLDNSALFLKHICHFNYAQAFRLQWASFRILEDMQWRQFAYYIHNKDGSTSASMCSVLCNVHGCIVSTYMSQIPSYQQWAHHKRQGELFYLLKTSKIRWVTHWTNN